MVTQEKMQTFKSQLFVYIYVHVTEKEDKSIMFFKSVIQLQRISIENGSINIE